MVSSADLIWTGQFQAEAGEAPSAVALATAKAIAKVRTGRFIERSLAWRTSSFGVEADILPTEGWAIDVEESSSGRTERTS
jgi:hypothetical protein